MRRILIDVCGMGGLPVFACPDMVLDQFGAQRTAYEEPRMLRTCAQCFSHLVQAVIRAKEMLLFVTSSDVLSIAAAVSQQVSVTISCQRRDKATRNAGDL